MGRFRPASELREVLTGCLSKSIGGFVRSRLIGRYSLDAFVAFVRRSFGRLQPRRPARSQRRLH
jgi:hypothetical protein